MSASSTAPTEPNQPEVTKPLAASPEPAAASPEPAAADPRPATAGPTPAHQPGQLRRWCASPIKVAVATCAATLLFVAVPVSAVSFVVGAVVAGEHSGSDHGHGWMPRDGRAKSGPDGREGRNSGSDADKRDNTRRGSDRRTPENKPSASTAPSTTAPAAPATPAS